MHLLRLLAVVAALLLLPQTATAARPQHRSAPEAHAARALSVPAAITRLRKLRQLDAKTANQYRRDWSTSVAVSGGLSGSRGSELRAVLHNTRAMAAGKLLTTNRLPAVMLTVTRNRDWWSKGPYLRPGGRTRFKGSQIVWQYYAGQGLQIQWLGTFGRANALWSFGGKDDELAQILTEARSLAANRAGGIAFEYLFNFGGGRPPWVSGLAQGTALTAFSRGALRLKNATYFNNAREALGIFRKPPPLGVRLASKPGVHYLQYSYDRNQRIGNGFVQSLNGLHDFALFANDDDGWKLFADGERHLRRELPIYDTGAWSLYEHRGSSRRGPESNLDYHKLIAQFLNGFCTRLTDDLERKKQVPSPKLYCRTARHFDRYVKQKPKLRIATGGLRSRSAGAVTVRIDKISSVSITVTARGRTLASRSGLLSRGSYRLKVRPPGRSAVTVRVSATDLAGNPASKRARLKVRARSR